MTQHTQGPWVLQPLGDGWHGYPDWSTFAVRSGGGNLCLAVIGEVDRATAEHNEANARLIAAAPDMLSALQTAEDALCRASFVIRGGPLMTDTNHAIDVVRAAIARAQGQGQGQEAQP